MDNADKRRTPLLEFARSEGARLSEVYGVATAASFEPLEREVQHVLEEAALFDLWYRPIVAVSGPDAAAFLQGLLSQDVKAMPPWSWRLSFLLHPNGKVDSFLRVAKIGDGERFLLDTDPSRGEALLESLARFLVRMKVKIEPVLDVGYLRLAGPKAPGVLERNVVHELPEGHALIRAVSEDFHGEIFVLEAPYPGMSMPEKADRVVSYDLVVSESAASDIWEALRAGGARPCGIDCLEAFRILAGFPAVGAELDEKTIVHETGLEKVAVSFEKGCYLGQELVARIESRGHVNRYLRRLRVVGHRGLESGKNRGAEAAGASRIPPSGAEIRSEEKAVGSVTSSAEIPSFGVVCLGYVRKEIEPGSRVRIVWDGLGVEAEVEDVSRAF